uniref:Expressed conserved protein n=1 Tax=Ascaris lumbricoides TaxID=6252 RepID=A0A0M3IB39_ASCLU
MSPQQSTFRHANSFSFGPSPTPLSHSAGENSGHHTPQQGPHFFLPSTPKSCQSTPSLGASHRRRYASNRPRSVVLFPPNTSQPPPTHPKMIISHSAPVMVPSVLQQSLHTYLSHQSLQHSKKNIKSGVQHHHRQLADSRGGSPVNCFAGAKFSESPKAQMIPLPPSQWLTDVSSSEASPSDSAIPLSPSSELEDVEHRSSSSAPNLCRAVPMRMNPLQLIAAVAAS